MSKKPSMARPSPYDGVVRTPEQDAELNRLFARALTSRAGELMLANLLTFTKNMVLGDGAINSERLIHLEGQRFIVHLMQSRLEHGRHPDPDPQPDANPRTRRRRSRTG